MSVLDTFYLLFKSQGADKVKKDQDGITRSSKDLEHNLKKTDFTTNQLSDSFLNLGKKLAIAAGSIASVGALISSFKESIDYAQNVDKASRALQVNTEDLDAWGTAVKRIGGTSEGFQTSLKNLSERLYVSGQDALTVLPKLADALQKMNRTQALRYGRTLGLDESTILLLRKGSKEVEKAIAHQKELGIVSSENAIIVRKYGQAWSDNSQAFRVSFLNAAAEVLPVITKVLKVFTSFSEHMQKHSNLIVGALLAIAAAAVAVAIPFIAANIVMIGVAAGIGTVIGALALAYDDIQAFLSGNSSITGEIADGWEAVGNSIIIAFMKAWKVVKGILLKMGSFSKKVFKDIYSAIPGAYSKVRNLFPHHEAVEALSGEDGSTGSLQKAQKAISMISSNPLVSAPPASFLTSGDSNRSVTLNIGDVSIETQATDVDRIAQTFRQTLQDQMRNAVSNFDDGVTI